MWRNRGYPGSAAGLLRAPGGAVVGLADVVAGDPTRLHYFSRAYALPYVGPGPPSAQ